MKVGIVGAGMVGATAAFALVMQGEASEIVLVDVNRARARAEAEDIAHAIPFASPAIVRAGEYADLDGAGVVILSCGVSQNPGETRLALLERNAGVFRQVVGQVMAVCPGAILLVASNPVDLMTQITMRLSGLPPGRVIGSGTILDTARFRWLVGRHLGISPGSVHGYVLGEHGDSEVLAWSSARAGSVPLESFAAQVSAPLTEDVRQRIDAGVRGAAYTIIEGKGATNYAIGVAGARIVEAVLGDQRRIMPVSTLIDYPGVGEVCMSLPAIVGRGGVEHQVDVPMNDEERAGLEASARSIRETAEKFGAL